MLVLHGMVVSAAFIGGRESAGPKCLYRGSWVQGCVCSEIREEPRSGPGTHEGR
jgi:hypothetical protein